MDSVHTLTFSFANLVEVLTFAFALGVAFMRIHVHAKDIDANKIELTALITTLKKEMKEQMNEMHERHDRLETRHITAIEKLGDSLSHFADEIRSSVGDHQTRLYHLERTKDK